MVDPARQRPFSIARCRVQPRRPPVQHLVRQQARVAALASEGRFENLSDACRAGLRRLEEDARVVDRLVSLGEEGMASGIDDGFDIDAFVDAVKPGT
ncbi:MAG: type II toxin-antitoxin system ParD family antitoxin [Alphaproteobacteria bacterium]|nr:type II toxin-antitoxin system ParD family antitoxin [Alphaproteobacteria bacterium]